MAFSPHIVHVVRSLAFFARALTCSNSRCLICQSINSPGAFFSAIVVRADERATCRD